MVQTLACTEDIIQEADFCLHFAVCQMLETRDNSLHMIVFAADGRPRALFPLKFYCNPVKMLLVM